jgi:hypothetical protein
MRVPIAGDRRRVRLPGAGVPYLMRQRSVLRQQEGEEKKYARRYGKTRAFWAID